MIICVASSVSSACRTAFRHPSRRSAVPVRAQFRITGATSTESAAFFGTRRALHFLLAELMVVTSVFDHEARKRSYEILAELWSDGWPREEARRTKKGDSEAGCRRPAEQVAPRARGARAEPRTRSWTSNTPLSVRSPAGPSNANACDGKRPRHDDPVCRDADLFTVEIGTEDMPDIPPNDGGRVLILRLHVVVAAGTAFLVLGAAGIALHRHEDARRRLDVPHDVHDVAGVLFAKLQADLAVQLPVRERRRGRAGPSVGERELGSGAVIACDGPRASRRRRCERRPGQAGGPSLNRRIDPLRTRAGTPRGRLAERAAPRRSDST